MDKSVTETELTSFGWARYTARKFVFTHIAQRPKDNVVDVYTRPFNCTHLIPNGKSKFILIIFELTLCQQLN